MDGQSSGLDKLDLDGRVPMMMDEPDLNGEPGKGLNLAPMMMDEFMNGGAPMMMDAPDLGEVLRPAPMMGYKPYGKCWRPGNDVTRRT